jgi:hypothetical protein
MNRLCMVSTNDRGTPNGVLQSSLEISMCRKCFPLLLSIQNDPSYLWVSDVDILLDVLNRSRFSWVELCGQFGTPNNTYHCHPNSSSIQSQSPILDPPDLSIL